MRLPAPVLALLLAALAAGCSQQEPEPAPEAAEDADVIYLGGPIVTVNHDDAVAEALALLDGGILAVGSREEVVEHAGSTTEVIDLQGKAVLPGFIDGHGHYTQVGMLASAVNVAPPPVGSVESIADLQGELRAALAASPPEPGGWLMGRGYDESLLAEQRPPTRDDLDAVSTDLPILVFHVSLHLAVMNSTALELAGITANTPNPAGGVIQRRPGSREPNGVLEEGALHAVIDLLPKPDERQALAALQAAGRVYASRGITTAQDGATLAPEIPLLMAAADAGLLPIDVIFYPLADDVGAAVGAALVPRAYRGRLKWGGVKLVLDGSPQGKTAWLSAPYHEPPPGRDADYAGYPWMPDEEVATRVEEYFAKGWQLLAHANGDAAAEQLIEAVEKATRKLGPGDRRTAMIHAQTVTETQLDRMLQVDIFPSFFVSHVFYWGDWHRDSVLGPIRAARISPAASAVHRDMHFTFHDDPPVVPGDPLRLIWAAVNRTTRSGRVLGPDQRIPVMEAIRAVTSHGAWAYFEEDRKGSIVPGKRADLVILSASPLEVEPDAIADIRVLETLKEGVSVFRADSP
jgi:predicted amidohydrolase YtcJ